MLREDFIAQMIAELTRQKDNDEDSFNQPRISSPKEIFQSLCYDFPVISTEELVILSKDISNFAASSADSQPLDTFWLNDKFVENLQYLSAFASSTNDTGRDKAVSSLCAAVFLMLPLRLLSMRRRELSTFLGGLSSCSDQPGQSYNFSIMPSGDIMLTWQEICLRYRYFVMQGTASLVSGVDAAALAGKRGGGLGGYDTCDGGYLEYLISAIKSVKWDGNVTRLGKNDYDSQTLGQCLLFNSEKDSKADMAHDDSSISLDPATMTASTSTFAGGGNTQIDVAECAVISGMAKDVWVHLSLLCRDLLVQYPEVLGLGSALSSVLGAVLPPDGALTPSTSFPTAAECMFVLILAGVVSGLSAPSALLVRGINLNASTHEDNVTVDNMEGRRETLSIRASHFQKARAGVLNYLDTFSSPTPMVAVVTICERMSRHSSNSDGAMLLSDITSVYASDVGYTATRIHDRLLTSRAVSALVHMWIEIVNDYFSASSLEVASATAMTSARAAASRIVQTLSVLCSHQQETAVFLLRIPTFVSHVLAASKQWQLYGTAAEVDNRAILSPGDSMGLITPLLLAAATLTGSPLESNFKDLFEGLQSSLQITGIRLSTAMNRTSAHSIINVVGQEGVSNSIEAKEVEGSVAALLEEKKASLNSRHVATIPLGLIGSLRLIANEDGFARTLRAVTLSRQVGPAQMVVSALKKWSAGALQSCTANRTMSRRQLGSDRKVLRPQPSSTGEDEIGRNANESIELDVKQDMGSDSNMERQLDFELETHLEGDLEPDSTIQEQVEEEERCTNELEDVRRLVKSLQAAIEGLSTSKID